MATFAFADKPRVPLSVRIISYKYDAWLPGSLGGLAMQSVMPAEVVASDDCSPAPHTQAFWDLAPQFPWVHFQQPPHNLGPVPHFRQLVAGVEQPYYLLMSADDTLVDSDFLRDAVAVFEQNPNVVAVFGRHVPVDVDGRLLVPEPPRASVEVRILPAQDLRDRLAFDNVVPAVCTVIRTSVHQQVPPFPIDNTLCHDWLQWYLMTFAGDFALIDRPVLHYRTHRGSLSAAHEHEAKVAKCVDEFYLALLNRPEVSAHDREQLRAGRIRKQLAYLPVRRLWRPVVEHVGTKQTWQALAETLSERGVRRLAQWRTALWSGQLAPGAQGLPDLAER